MVRLRIGRTARSQFPAVQEAILRSLPQASFQGVPGGSEPGRPRRATPWDVPPSDRTERATAWPVARSPYGRPRRPLPHRARARRRRHGHGVSRPGPQARPQGRHQGAAAGARRRHRRRAVPAPRSRPPRTSSIRTSCRCSTRAQADGFLFYVMPFVEGEIAPRPAAPREAAPDRRRGADRDRSRRRARLRPPPRRHPSRHQAREHPAARRPRAGRRLRHRAGREQGRRRPDDRDRHVARHAALHEPRAGDGRARDHRPHATSTRSARDRTRCWSASRRSPGPTAQAIIAKVMTERSRHASVQRKSAAARSKPRSSPRWRSSRPIASRARPNSPRRSTAPTTRSPVAAHAAAPGFSGARCRWWECSALCSCRSMLARPARG